MSSPKVTIILTSHNRPQMLHEAIQSVIQQTMKEWELIIIDDYSVDPRVKDVLKWAKSDSRIKPFITNYNCNNIAVLWNLGLDLARGQYVALLDDDNRKKPQFCTLMSGYLDKHSNMDAVACFSDIFDDRNKEKRVFNVFDSPIRMTKQNILKENHVDSGCMMWRRSVIEKIGWFDERLKTTEDWDYVIRLVYQTNGFGIIPIPLTDYRWHRQNRTYTADGLGLVLHKQFISEVKQFREVSSVVLFHQDSNKITLSQNNVLEGLRSGLESLSNIKVVDVDVSHISSMPKSDYVVVFAPFAIPLEHFETLRAKSDNIMFFLCEDPQAITSNLSRAKYADFISTNDKSTIIAHERIVGVGNVAYCPSISFNNKKIKLRNKVKRIRDVLFVGYPYESRVAFAKQLVPKLSCRITFLGDSWKEYFPNEECLDTKDEQTTMEMMEESRIVLLYNRQHTDLGGSKDSIRPYSVVRGYFECASGSVVMIDNNRPHSSLQSYVQFYNSVDDLANKVKDTLDKYKVSVLMGDVAKQVAITQWTYEKRIGELFNAFRSRRFYYEVR